MPPPAAAAATAAAALAWLLLLVSRCRCRCRCCCRRAALSVPLPLQVVGRYLVEIWKAVGMNMERVEFLSASGEMEVVACTWALVFSFHFTVGWCSNGRGARGVPVCVRRAFFLGKWPLVHGSCRPQGPECPPSMA